MENHASIPSESQQYQQYYQHYQQQPPHQQQEEPTNPNAYDPSTQAHYASFQYYNQNPHQQQEPALDYSSYYYQSHPQADPNPIHPPGVAIPAETPQTLVQNHPDVYYNHGFVNLQQQQPQSLYMPPGYSTFAAGGGRGGRPVRGGRQGSFRGRGGRGRGRGGTRATTSVNHTASGNPKRAPQPSSSGPGQSALAPPRMAWCELCRVDCNTPEVLEQHKNGKKHKKNLKVYEELQSISKIQVGLQNPQVPVSDSKLGAVEPEKNEGGSAEKQPMIPETVSGNNNGGVDTNKDAADVAKSSGGQTSDKREQIGGTRGGLKRKIRGGRVVKSMRCSDGSRKFVEPAKPKKAVDLFCELCNVKCESHVVFNSHVAGKKHLSNIKKLQGHQSIIGGGVQALYPPVSKVPSTLQALYPPTPNVPSAQPTAQENQQQLTEAEAHTSTLVNQQGAVHDPQAALVQLLNQHGIQDAHSLLSQIIPVLLTQVLPNGATPVTSSQPGEPGYGFPANVTQDQLNSVARMSSGEKESKCEMVADETVQKTEFSEGVADISNTGTLELQG